MMLSHHQEWRTECEHRAGCHATAGAVRDTVTDVKNFHKRGERGQGDCRARLGFECRAGFVFSDPVDCTPWHSV